MTFTQRWIPDFLNTGLASSILTVSYKLYEIRENKVHPLGFPLFKMWTKAPVEKWYWKVSSKSPFRENFLTSCLNSMKPILNDKRKGDFYSTCDQDITSGNLIN